MIQIKVDNHWGGGTNTHYLLKGAREKKRHFRRVLFEAANRPTHRKKGQPLPPQQKKNIKKRIENEFILVINQVWLEEEGKFACCGLVDGIKNRGFAA